MIANIPNLNISQAKIADYCQRWQITKMELFGSVLRHDFRPDSDIDVLVTFAPDARWTLFDMVDIRDEFIQLVGRDADLLTRKSIERSPNYIRRKAILESARVIYEV
jgi:uncharacterized protein